MQKPSPLPLGVLLTGLLALHLAQAQTLYKWVDTQGRITYSDRPASPDTQVKDVSNTVNTMGAGEAQAGTLGFEAAQTAGKSPVTLYAAKGCGPCDEGRSLLRQRGIPYQEKWIETPADIAALQSKFNAQTLPLLTVGSNVRSGFSPSDWDSALDAAGYAKQNTLPKGFVTGKVDKLTTPQAKPNSTTTHTAQTKPSTARPTDSAVDAGAGGNTPTVKRADSEPSAPTLRF